ncbi:MAG: hypothetical protein ACLP7O_15385 [Terracidiphilus sp.]
MRARRRIRLSFRFRLEVGVRLRQRFGDQDRQAIFLRLDFLRFSLARRIEFGIRQTATSSAAAAPAPAAAIIAIVTARLLYGSRHWRNRRSHRNRHAIGRNPFRRADRRYCLRRQRGRGRLVQLEDLVLHAGDDLVVLVVVFEKVRDVQECVAFQTDIDESRLHARQYARHSAFVDAACQGVFILPLVVNFHYLIVLEHRYTCFVAVRGNHQLLRHPMPPGGAWRDGTDRKVLQGSLGPGVEQHASYTAWPGTISLPREALARHRPQGLLQAPNKFLIHKPSEADIVDQPQR